MTCPKQKLAAILVSLFAIAKPALAQAVEGSQPSPPLESARQAVLNPSETLLDRMIQEALASYPSIRANESLLQAARNDVNAAKLRFFPNLTLSNSRSNVTLANQSGTQQSASNLTITQPIFQGGGLEAGRNKASAKVMASAQAIREIKQDVTRRVISNYGEWLRAYLKISAQQENVQLHEKLVALISSRVREEVASRADMNLAISRLLLAKADLATQLSLEKSALNSLSQLLGRTVLRKELAGFKAAPKTLPDRDQILEVARLNSPSIQRFTHEAQVSLEESKEIKAQLLPQVSLQAQVQVGNAVLPNAPNYNSIGFTLNYVTGNGLATMASARSAQSRAQASELQIQTAHRELNDRLTAEINEYEFSKIKVESLQKSADLAEEISDSYDRQFLVGRKSWLDLMNTVRERAQNKFSLADVEVSLIVSSWKISVALNDDNTEQDATELPLISIFR